MLDNHAPPERQTITRTLTITTVETWSITIGPGNAREEVAIDHAVEETTSETVGEET